MRIFCCVNVETVSGVSDNFTAEVEDSVLTGDVVHIRLRDQDVGPALHDLLQAAHQARGTAWQTTEAPRLRRGDLQPRLVLLAVLLAELGSEVDHPH